MDFHVWAKLDPEGRIQSVQSSCTQSPQASSPLWPFGPTEDGINGTAKSNNETSERVVPYVEKKKLVYKLDAKVDEMSVIMTQLAELTKRVKVQEKLIAQYEEKLRVQSKQLKTLEKENKKLKSDRHLTKNTNSFVSFSDNSLTIPKYSDPDFKMVCNLEKSSLSSSWPGDKGYIENKEEADLRKDSREDSDLDDVDGAISSQPFDTNSNSVVRPSSLRFGFDIYGSLPGADVDVQGHFNIQHRDSSIRNGYSYVKKDEHFFLEPNNLQQSLLAEAFDDEFNEEKVEYSEKQQTTPALGPVKSDGYLDMKVPKDASPEDESFYSLSKETDENFFQVDQCKNDGTAYVDNEAIHSTWRDVKDGNVIIEKSTDTAAKFHLLPDGYLEPKGCTNDYMDLTILDENVSHFPVSPPLPSRRDRSDSRGSKGSSSLDRHSSSSSSSSSHSDRSPVCEDYIRRKSLPVSTYTCSRSPNTGGSRTRFATTRLVQSFDSPMVNNSPLPPPGNGRSSSADMKKDDHLNKVYRDMRTTMEWNKAKKKLISKSNDNTIDKVELRLRSTVREVYEAYSRLQTEKGTRLKRYSKETLMERVKARTGKSPADKSVSEEFMKKCLDLVMSNFPR